MNERTAKAFKASSPLGMVLASIKRVEFTGTTTKVFALKSNACGYSDVKRLTFNGATDSIDYLNYKMLSAAETLNARDLVAEETNQNYGRDFNADKAVGVKIAQTIEVNYSTWELQHTNYQPSAFGNRSTPIVTISGQWFSRDTAEATATLQAIHLLRSATSMFYGRSDTKNKGVPPPIGRLSAHGLYSNTPVVVKTFQYDYPNDVDYITVDMFNGRQSVPVLFEMSVSLIVQINAVEAVKEYTLENFYTGKLLGNGYI